ncbi:FAD binding protein [Actinoalloteichus sp. GBA129-24]|uniref:FAD binding protein n=1 Tax=Actinoalloteichus fjordicus TaxID=1612552 RepID=A0AAC9LAV7_9PSEU|nr:MULTISPECIES: FAD-dependent monooxygenase [Actinoalloteichus]APU14538.1 FAD binding protein [Actinoalloteichus fjordicus]APU20506.1 FAD binding protein [Actinoalloteichus sp. GBA129-24]
MSDDRIPVVIAGGGTVGSAMAAFLADHGIVSLVAEAEATPSIHPRATGLGRRTMEILRQAGLAEQVGALAVDLAGSMGKISAPTLASADLSATPRRHGRTELPPTRQSRLGPVELSASCPQNRLDAVLSSAARKGGAAVVHLTRLRSFSQDDIGVTSVLDCPDGTRSVRSDYLIGADGARSGVRDALEIGTSGPSGLGRPMINVLFHADLDAYTAGRRFAGCDITTPEAPGMLVTVGGATNWIFHTAAESIAGRARQLTPRRCRELIRAAVGIRTST